MVEGQLIGMEQTYQPLKGCWRVSSSRQIMPALCLMFTLVPSQITTFMLPVFAFCSLKLVTNDSVMSLLEPDSRVVYG